MLTACHDAVEQPDAVGRQWKVGSFVAVEPGETLTYLLHSSCTDTQEFGPFWLARVHGLPADPADAVEVEWLESTDRAAFAPSGVIDTVASQHILAQVSRTFFLMTPLTLCAGLPRSKLSPRPPQGSDLSPGDVLPGPWEA